ncbi:myogenesis-regulating glycosidase-like [Tachypleus tridentatus]|uniref:myogenesis-regulating glycosidase-like n=1 Tax=Tachypleus tridentatus TaxID=6853 RepID=UPI003FCF1C0D
MELDESISMDDLPSCDSGLHSNQTTLTSLGSWKSEDRLPHHSLNSTPLESPVQSPRSPRKFPGDFRLIVDGDTWDQFSGNKNGNRSPTKYLKQSFHQMTIKFSALVKKTTSSEFRFKIVLFLLFSSIIVLVTFTTLLYQQHLKELAIGDKIRFHELKRNLHILRHDGRNLLTGHLGLKIPADLPPLDCQFLHEEDGPNICVEWKYRARLQIDYVHEDRLSCYNIHWKSLGRDTILKDCYALSGAFWFGMGEINKTSFPFSNTTLQLQPFVTGNEYQDNMGPILERYWLSSKGIAIRVDEEVPLYISVNNSGDEELCFEAKLNGFPYKTTKTKLPFLQYTICTEDNIILAHLDTVKKFRTETSNITYDFNIFKTPVWATEPKLKNVLNNQSLLSFVNQITEERLEPGYILLHSNWQKHFGDFDFHSNYFGSPKELINILHRKGFKILLTVYPYLCLESPVFMVGLNQSYFISDSTRNVPLLSNWQDSVCATIEIANQDAIEWFVSRLKQVRIRYNFDGFVFAGGYSSFLPRSYNYEDKFINPDCSLTYFLKASQENRLFAGAGIGFQTQNINEFVQIAPRTSTWDSSKGIASIVPTVLTLQLLGYPIINPGSVGGDILTNMNDTKPERQLYIRWLQLAAFMPVLQFSFLPGDYNKEVIEIANKMYKIRKQKIVPLLEQCLKEYEENGIPPLRPLWWLEPKGLNAFIAKEQFSVGNEIIVAPVLEEGREHIDVYLPHGWWRDEITAVKLRGGKWLHNYHVPLDKVAYFTRLNNMI